jgi:hypothetical protein
VNVIASGSATSGTDYDNFITSLTIAAAATTGVSFDGTDTLTFDANFVGPSFSFSVDAINDQTVEGTEVITATLSGQVVDNGSATLGTAVTNTNITELDADVTFAISSTPSISEDLQETATFTINVGGDALTGTNTASVNVIASGSATSGTDYDNFITSITNAAAATAGVTFDGTDTLTFDSTFNANTGTGAFAFTVDAINDQTVEGTETITATLSGQVVDNGSATLGTAVTNTNITELDAAVTFAISSTPSISEDLQETATFTINVGGDALVGTNTASVNVIASGSATSGTDYNNFITSITNAAAATAGVRLDGTDTMTLD